MNNQANQGFTGGQILLALLGGAAVGAGVALLTAPNSGAQTRAELRRLALSTRDRAMSLPSAVAGAVEAGSDSFSHSLTAAAKASRHTNHA